jgi:phosphoribosylanthranilate isomerase
MLVQIYSLTSPADVEACAAAGVDHVGVAAGDQDVPASISNERARDLFERWPDGPDRRTSALSVHTHPDAIVAYARAVDPDILHICSDTYAVDVAETRRVRERLPDGTDLMKAVDVAGPAAVEAARAFEPVSDWLLLDTATDDVEGVGASGRTHDWSVSREVVDAVDVPVVLAGGLGPDNVAEAVRTVRPAGVDSYTHTSASERRKDPEKVRAFAENARRAAASIDGG